MVLAQSFAQGAQWPTSLDEEGDLSLSSSCGSKKSDNLSIVGQGLLSTD
jgi:hypothetical protein